MNNPSGPFMDNSSFENFSDNTTRRLKHPVITFFHLIFRSLALIGARFKETKYFLFNTDNFSLPPLRLVLRQLYWQLCQHYFAAFSGFLDGEEHHRSVHGRTPVVELHWQWRGVQVGVWVPVLGAGPCLASETFLHGDLHLLGRTCCGSGTLGKYFVDNE